MAEPTSFSGRAPSRPLIALPGTLLPPTIFAPVALPTGWHWQLVDWLREPESGDLSATAARLAREWKDDGRVLVGHSAGGVMALQMAATLGPRLAGLVLIDTGASSAGHGDPDLPDRLRREWGEAFLTAFLTRCVGPDALTQRGETLSDYARLIGPERAHRAMTTLRQLDLTSRLAEVRCPTLVLHGRDDPARRLHHARALAEGIAGARLEVLDAGHTPMLTCPDRFAELMGRWLEALPQR